MIFKLTHLVIKVLDDFFQYVGGDLRKIDFTFALGKVTSQHGLNGFTHTGAFAVDDKFVTFRAA